MKKFAAQAQPRTEKHRHGGIDWAAIEADFATGAFTQRQLTVKYGVNESTLSRRIKMDRARNPASWGEKMVSKVKAATAAMLAGDALRQQAKDGQALGAVLAVAAATRDVILGPRRDIGAARRVWTALLAELEATTTTPKQLAQLIARAGQDLDAADRKALHAQLADLMQLHQRVGSIQRLADATIKLQAAERRAFGLKDDDGGSDPLDQMTEAELEAQIATLEAGRVAGTPALKLVG
jgi:hypothetical protein